MSPVQVVYYIIDRAHCKVGTDVQLNTTSIAASWLRENTEPGPTETSTSTAVVPTLHRSYPITPLPLQVQQMPHTSGDDGAAYVGATVQLITCATAVGM
jgi:hypothetical protein